MADQPALRVLFRFQFGLPMRQASDEEREKARELVRETFQKWNSSGVKLIGTFGNQGALDGFAHYMILEVDDVNKVQEIDRDITFGEVGKFIEKYSFHVGWARTFFEDIWKSS